MANNFLGTQSTLTVESPDGVTYCYLDVGINVAADPGWNKGIGEATCDKDFTVESSTGATWVYDRQDKTSIQSSSKHWSTPVSGVPGQYLSRTWMASCASGETVWDTYTATIDTPDGSAEYGEPSDEDTCE
ncbi:MAG TPA: hypothetical protein VGC05_08755 [Mycobacterium sp.]